MLQCLKSTNDAAVAIQRDVAAIDHLDGAYGEAAIGYRVLRGMIRWVIRCVVPNRNIFSGTAIVTAMVGALPFSARHRSLATLDAGVEIFLIVIGSNADTAFA
jgi:hypothetical protein